MLWLWGMGCGLRFVGGWGKTGFEDGVGEDVGERWTGAALACEYTSSDACGVLRGGFFVHSAGPCSCLGQGNGMGAEYALSLPPSFSLS